MKSKKTLNEMFEALNGINPNLPQSSPVMEAMSQKLNPLAVKAFLLKTKQDLNSSMSHGGGDIRNWAMQKIDDTPIFNVYQPNEKLGIASNLVLYLKNKPSAFDQFMPQLREDDLNELSPDLFKRAIDVSSNRSQDTRTYNLGSTYFNEFKGKPLMGGTIKDIGVFKPRSGAYNFVNIQIFTPARSQGFGSAPEKTDSVSYDIENDSYDLRNTEISREDARTLAKIAMKINPNTKYKNGTADFRIKGYGMPSMPQ